MSDTYFFNALMEHLHLSFRDAPLVHTERWQSVDISQMPHMAMRERLHFSFQLPLLTEDLQFYRDTIKPNLPWADNHFEQDRVSGMPLNPGKTYQDWNPGQMAGGNNSSTHLRDGKQFDHSYAERYWPCRAGLTIGGVLNGDDEFKVLGSGHHGIRFRYGDLNDLVTVLSQEPLTRQAYLPVWFPEDLGAIVDKRARVPCSLGYHFIMRDGSLDITYSIRSCDVHRHFRDDVYLTIRLLLWVLDQCRLAAPERDWADVQPGQLIMHITSLHMFQADHKRIYKEKP